MCLKLKEEFIFTAGWDLAIITQFCIVYFLLATDAELKLYHFCFYPHTNLSNIKNK